jgi:ABC-type glycerol-3-phosphate transport system substrate-binding protein
MERFLNKRHVLIVLVCVLVLTGISACKKSGAPSKDVTAEITLMMWSGDDKLYKDIGNQNLAPQDLPAQNVAAAYATAKAFKAVYPNVKVNIYAKSGDPNADGLWEQHRENFRMEYGIYPDMWACQDLIGDAQKGLIADLSIFADDPMYKSFNPAVMATMNLDGRQFGIPQYLIPWAVYVNKSLAEANNIDVPDPNWTIAEYTRFVSHSRPNVFYGSMGSFSDDLRLLETGTKDYTYQVINRKPGEPYANFNSEANRSLLRYLAQWSNDAVWPNFDQGKVSGEFMDEHWWWAFKFFIEGKLLTNTADPWMMGDAAHSNPDHWGAVKAADWDIYPRPSTDYMPNTVGIVLDPFVIRNYAMDDGNPALSSEEEAKLRIAWEFAKFWCGDTRAIDARAKQSFQDGETLRSCLNDSFPIVTGPEFTKQMQIWYTTDNHRRFADKNKMPGFQYVLELWEKGQFWDYSDKAFPRYYDFEGSRRDIVFEWLNAFNAEVAGADRFDPNWLDQVYARLSAWNAVFNQRWEDEWRSLSASLDRYYPKK